MNPALRRVAVVLRPALTFVLSFFFERKYLSGRHFDPGFAGYAWAIKAIWCRSVLRLAPPLPWPAAISCQVSNPRNMIFHPDNLDNFQSPGTYFQNFSSQIQIGHGTYIAPNVGLITANHQLENLDAHQPGRAIIIGERCWIGMNAVVLPGVTLGAGTVVAAGAVVTKSFPEGNVIIGGIPARVIKLLVPAEH